MDRDLEKNAAQEGGQRESIAKTIDMESAAPTLISHTPDPTLRQPHHEAIASRDSLPVCVFFIPAKYSVYLHPWRLLDFTGRAAGGCC